MKQIAFALWCALLCACSVLTENDGIGQLEQELNYVRAVDGLTPSSFQVNFRDVADTAGPFWISFAFWTEADDVTAGAVTGDVNYIDPIGESRVINGNPISLADPTGFDTTPAEMIVLESGTSAWTFDFTLFGSAGSALVGYRIMHSAGASYDFQSW